MPSNRRRSGACHRRARHKQRARKARARNSSVNCRRRRASHSWLPTAASRRLCFRRCQLDVADCYSERKSGNKSNRTRDGFRLDDADGPADRQPRHTCESHAHNIRGRREHSTKTLEKERESGPRRQLVSEHDESRSAARHVTEASTEASKATRRRRRPRVEPIRGFLITSIHTTRTAFLVGTAGAIPPVLALRGWPFFGQCAQPK